MIKLSKIKRNYRGLKSEIDYDDSKAVVENIKLSFRNNINKLGHKLSTNNLKILNEGSSFEVHSQRYKRHSVVHQSQNSSNGVYSLGAPKLAPRKDLIKSDRNRKSRFLENDKSDSIKSQSSNDLVFIKNTEVDMNNSNKYTCHNCGSKVDNFEAEFFIHSYNSSHSIFILNNSYIRN